MQPLSPIKPALLFNRRRFPGTPGQLVLASLDRFERTQPTPLPRFGSSGPYDPRFWVVTEKLPAAYIKVGKEVWTSPLTQEQERALLLAGRFYTLCQQYQLFILHAVSDYPNVDAAKIFQEVLRGFQAPSSREGARFSFQYNPMLPYPQRSFAHYLLDTFHEVMVDQWARARDREFPLRWEPPTEAEIRASFPGQNPLFVMACLNTLGERQRAVYTLRKIKNIPRETIRNLLNISSVRVVDSHYTHAAANLKPILSGCINRSNNPEHANRLLESVIATMLTPIERHYLYQEAQLSPYQKLVFYACAVQRFTPPELARYLGRSPTGIQQALEEARNKLYPVLEKIDYRNPAFRHLVIPAPQQKLGGLKVPLGFLQTGWRSSASEEIPADIQRLDIQAQIVRNQRQPKEYQVLLPNHFRKRQPDWMVCFDTLDPLHQAVYLLNKASVPHELISDFLGISSPDGVNNIIHKVVIPALDQWRKTPPQGERLKKRYFYASLRHRLGKAELLALFRAVRLTELERQVAYLTVFHNLTQPEISRLLERTTDGVSVALAKARQKIIPLAVQSNLIPEGYVQ